MHRNPVSIIIGAILLAVFLVLLFVFQVRRSEVAIVTTFGKPTRTAVAGPHFRLPWPIQKVYKFDQRIQSFEDKLVEDLTADSNTLLTQVYVGWRITDPQAFFPKFGGDSAAEAEKKVLEGMIRSAKNGVIGKHPLGDFVSAAGEQKFEAIEQEILGALQQQLKANNYGIEVTFLGIKKLGLPEAVTQSVFDRMKREREVLSSSYESEGAAEAAKIRSKADAEAAKTLANAEREARGIRAQGEAYAAQVLPAFQQNPELATFLLKLDALELSLKDRSTLIFDASTPPFDLFRASSTNLLKK
jgi:membrane protease subunit HflC